LMSSGRQSSDQGWRSSGHERRTPRRLSSAGLGRSSPSVGIHQSSPNQDFADFHNWQVFRELKSRNPRLALLTTRGRNSMVGVYLNTASHKRNATHAPPNHICDIDFETRLWGWGVLSNRFRRFSFGKGYILTSRSFIVHNVEQHCA
jgi:hypothetical protein